MQYSTAYFVLFTSEIVVHKLYCTVNLHCLLERSVQTSVIKSDYVFMIGCLCFYFSTYGMNTYTLF
jgi:hypothetical protein